MDRPIDSILQMKVRESFLDGLAQLVKNLPAMQETWVRSLGWEDRLEKGKATHGSVLAWRIPWTEAPGGLQSVGLQRLKRDTVTESSFLLPPSFSLLKILSRIPSNLAFTPCVSPRLLLLKVFPVPVSPSSRVEPQVSSQAAGACQAVGVPGVQGAAFSSSFS